MKIKARLVRASDRHGYYLTIYKSGPNGEIYEAKPINLEFEEEDRRCMFSRPSFYFDKDCVDYSATDNELEKLLKQKEVDKSKHITDLMSIIEKFMENNNGK